MSTDFLTFYWTTSKWIKFLIQLETIKSPQEIVVFFDKKKIHQKSPTKIFWVCRRAESWTSEKNGQEIGSNWLLLSHRSSPGAVSELLFSIASSSASHFTLTWTSSSKLDTIQIFSFVRVENLIITQPAKPSPAQDELKTRSNWSLLKWQHPLSLYRPPHPHRYHLSSCVFLGDGDKTTASDRWKDECSRLKKKIFYLFAHHTFNI